MRPWAGSPISSPRHGAPAMNMAQRVQARLRVSSFALRRYAEQCRAFHGYGTASCFSVWAGGPAWTGLSRRCGGLGVGVSQR